MRRIFTVILVMTVCVGALAAAGCDQTGKAKSYMEEGDALSKQMRSLSDDAVFDVTALLAELGVQVSETGEVDPETITDAANKQIDEIVADSEKAKAEYEKILDLDDVEDYKAYAEERIKAIDSATAVLEAVKELLDDIGDPANKKSVSDTAADWAKSNVQVAVDFVKAYTSWSNAEKIKREKNLGSADGAEDESAKQSVPASTP